MALLVNLCAAEQYFYATLHLNSMSVGFKGLEYSQLMTAHEVLLPDLGEV